jgi:hypothetical protein
MSEPIVTLRPSMPVARACRLSGAIERSGSFATASDSAHPGASRPDDGRFRSSPGPGQRSVPRHREFVSRDPDVCDVLRAGRISTVHDVARDALSIRANGQKLRPREFRAVGDRNFQVKCFRKMHELKKRANVSIVLVAHNEMIIREYAQRCIVLDKGVIQYQGPREDAISPEHLCPILMDCFPQPDCGMQDCPWQRLGQSVIALWRTSQFSPVVVGARPPPLLSRRI